MARKKWVSQTLVTPEVLKGREKRKWQIAFRRYVIERKPSLMYAPYFGLDVEKLREWVELQFERGDSWEDFGVKWQFDHIIPVASFDFSLESELRLCWNFMNMRVKTIDPSKEDPGWLDLLKAKAYFNQLYDATNHPVCLQLLQKIATLEKIESLNIDKQQHFIAANKPYLDMIANYSSFEFDLLNNGRSIAEVAKELAFLKKF